MEPQLKNQRKNFMAEQQESDQLLLRREEFAVNLRKTKKKHLLEQKRRKIVEHSLVNQTQSAHFPQCEEM